MKNRSFYPRSLVAFLMATGFSVAAVTGTVLYVVPKGSIANWTGWTLGGLDKEVWGDVHIVTGALFIVAGLLHVYFNWKPLKAYLFSRASRGLNRAWELAAALALTGFVVVGAVEGWPPVSYLLEFNDWARTDLWASSGVVRGGRGQIATPATEHDQALGRVTEGIDAALAEAVAKAGAVPPAPAELDSTATEIHGSGGGGRGSGRGSGGGSGFGRMTLADLADRYGLDYQQISARLAAAGIPFAEGERLRDIAARAGMTPGDLGLLARGSD